MKQVEKYVDNVTNKSRIAELEGVIAELCDALENEAQTGAFPDEAIGWANYGRNHIGDLA